MAGISSFCEELLRRTWKVFRIDRLLSDTKQDRDVDLEVFIQVLGRRGSAHGGQG